MSHYSPIIPQVCNVLEQHGDRLSLADLARAVGTSPSEVRRQVEAYADLEPERADDQYAGDFYHLVIDPADQVSDDPEPSDDDWVVLNVTSERVVGVEQFDAAVLAPLYQAAERLLLEEPDNEDLQEAVATLRQRFLPGILRPRHFRGPWVGELGRAIQEQRRVRIVYSRIWNPGVTERVIDPYALVHTSRGAEVDAGPVDSDGQIRTFLVSRIRELEVLDESFDRPEDAADLSIAQRALTRITGFVPPSGRWVLDKWAERVEVDSEDATGLQFTAHVLPPVEWRCALMMLMAGPEAWIDQPDLDAEKGVLAERLLAHHRLNAAG
jgi:proteasome accessory factor C